MQISLLTTFEDYYFTLALMSESVAAITCIAKKVLPRR